MVTIIDGGGDNPRELTVSGEKFQVHVKIWKINGVEVVDMKEVCPVEYFVELGKWLEKV